MDKIKPLLVHKFWILFGVTLLLPFVGWWMATGNLAAEIDERQQAIEQAIGSVPTQNDIPNKDWNESLKNINVVQEDRLKEAAENLWLKQQELMVWPRDIRDLMVQIPYRGNVPNTARDLYRTSYYDEIRRVRAIVDPLDETNEKGKVHVPWEVIPQVPRQVWGDLPPTSDEMWDEQQDVWLLTDLMTSIAAVNQSVDADSILDAPVKEIRDLVLRGGTKVTDQPAAAGAGAEGGMPGPEMPGSGMGRGFGGGGGGRNNRGGSTSVDFDLQSEFGSDTETTTAAGGGAGGAEAPMTGEMPTTGSGGEGGRRQRKRYVDDEDDLPFRTRAFYLKVVMDHRFVPQLLVELSNSRWPVKIVRVHQMDIHQDPVGSGTGGGRSPMGGGIRSSTRPIRSSTPMSDFPTNPGSGRSGRTGQSSVQGMYATAMADTYLAEVVVAGLMTLYKPPEHDADNGDTSAPSNSGVLENGEFASDEMPLDDPLSPNSGTPLPGDGDDAVTPVPSDEIPLPQDGSTSPNPVPSDASEESPEPLPTLDDGELTGDSGTEPVSPAGNESPN